MTVNRQHIADRPQSPSRLRARARYLDREIAFRIPWLRNRLEPGALSPLDAAAKWDKDLSSTHFETYLGGTLDVDLRNAITSMLMRYRVNGHPSILDVGCAGGTLLRA